MTTQTAVMSPVEIVRRNRGWFFAMAAALTVLGFAAIIMPHVASIAVEVMAGWILLIGGIASFIHSIKSKEHGSFWPVFLGSIVYMLAGVLLLRFPLQGVITLTLIMAICFAVGGLFKIVFALNAKPLGGWGWIALNGMITVVLGFMIWAGLPGTASWAIGLIVGIDMLFAGFATFMLASAAGNG